MTRSHFFLQSLLTLFNYGLFFGFPLACALRMYLQLTAGGGILQSVVICTLGEFFNHLVNFIDHIKIITVVIKSNQNGLPSLRKKPNVYKARHARILGNIRCNIN